MDRHDFVETLIKERDELVKTLTVLDLKIKTAKQRTLEYVLERFTKSESKECCYVNNSCGGGSWTADIAFNEKLLVSNEHIIKLGHDIHNLKFKVVERERELEELKSRDFLTYLKESI